MYKDIERYIIDNKLKNESEVWPLLKYKITRKDTIDNDTTDMEYKSNSYIRILIAALISVINLFLSIFRRKEAVFFGALTRAKISSNGIQDEFIGKKLQGNCFFLYHCANFETINLYFALKQGVIFENVVVKIFNLISRRKYTKEFDGYLSNDFLALLKEKYDLSEEQIISLLVDFRLKRDAYKSIIQFLKVNKVLVVSSYTKPAIVSAANRLNKATIEYQHGLLAPFHPSYQYAGSTSWCSTFIPKEIVLSSNFWKHNMEKANFVALEGILLAQDAQSSINLDQQAVFDKLGYNNFVTFTGQGICYNEIIVFIKEFLIEYPNYILVYRPHPREHNNYTTVVKKVADPRLHVVDRNLLQNTTALINASKAHFSIYSSCHFEALELLGKTYVLDVMKNNLMQIDCKNDNIIFFKSVSQITNL